VAQWWYCLRHQRVEPEEGCANAERLGPFETQAEAARALEIAKERNEEWDRDEDEWGSGSKESS
jgi:hypothetical protein